MRKHHQKQLRVCTRASKTTFQFPYWLNTQLTQYLICKNKPSKLPYWQTHNPPSAYLILHYAPTKMCAHCPCTRSVHIMCMYMLRTLYLKGRLQQLLAIRSQKQGSTYEAFFPIFYKSCSRHIATQKRRGKDRPAALRWLGKREGVGYQAPSCSTGTHYVLSIQTGHGHRKTRGFECVYTLEIVCTYT